MENIVKRADYIIDVIKPVISDEIPGPNSYGSLKDISVDIRIRCDLTIPNGEKISYGFGRLEYHMQIEDRIYSIDRKFLKEVIRHLPISQKREINKYYGS